MCELDEASGLEVDRGLEVGRGVKVCWDDNTAVYIVAIEGSESKKKKKSVNSDSSEPLQY